MSTLYERLGGKEAVEVAVENFYKKVLKDERINHYFDGIDMRKQKAKQRAFLTFVFGGPSNYEGKDMRKAHSHLVGLSDEHFNAVVENLAGTLKELNISEVDIQEVAGIAESVRGEVLNK